MKKTLVLFLILAFFCNGTLQVCGQDSAWVMTPELRDQLYASPKPFRAGQQTWDLDVADMDQDGHLDVVSITKNDRQVHVHLNDGEGNFSRIGHFPGPKDGRAVHIFDANGDQYPDVAAVGITEGLRILFNDGRGALKPTQAYPISGMPHDVIALDLEGDGDQDLAVVAVWKHQVLLYQNDGQGRYRAASPLTGLREPRRLLHADLDGDGHKDLLVGCDDGKVWVFYRQADGKLARKGQAISATDNNWALAVADFNADGLPDLAAGCYIDQSVTVHLNQGGQSFQRKKIISGDHNFDLTVADLDQDGDLDLISCSTLDNAMHLHLNDGAGNFTSNIELSSGDWNAAVSGGDFDGDGDHDLVTASINDGMVNLHHSLYEEMQVTTAPPPCLTGTVYDGEDSTVLGKAIVSLWHPRRDGPSVEAEQADEQGRFELCPPTDRNYIIRVQAPQWPTYQESFFMPNEPLEKDLYLFRHSFLHGYITDAKSEAPLAGAEVTLLDQGNQVMATAEADEEGHYRFDLPFGSYRLRATFPAYQPEGAAATLSAEDVPDGKQVDLALAKPEIICVTGVVSDEKTGAPIPRAKIVVTDTFDVAVDSFRADEKGQYRQCLPYDHYRFATTAKGYFFKVTELSVFPDESGQNADLQHDIQLKPLEPNARIVLRNIYYDYDKWFLRPESITELNHLLDIMRDNPSLVVEISGHTDSDGSLEYNDLLSQRRAQSVVDYLLEHGISTDRMQAKGFGERQPIAPNDSDANKQLNRRTEFRVVDF